MRSIFAGMIMLWASMAVVDTAQAQIRPERPAGYGSMQAPIGHQQPTQDELHRARMNSRRSTRTISCSICRQARMILLAPGRPRGSMVNQGRLPKLRER
jgi:hypothetical protein